MPKPRINTQFSSLIFFLILRNKNYAIKTTYITCLKHLLAETIMHYYLNSISSRGISKLVYFRLQTTINETSIIAIWQKLIFTSFLSLHNKKSLYNMIIYLRHTSIIKEVFLNYSLSIIAYYEENTYYYSNTNFCWGNKKELFD